MIFYYILIFKYIHVCGFESYFPPFFSIFDYTLLILHNYIIYGPSLLLWAECIGHSCETQLTTVINGWAKILDNRGQVDTFILDFEKAFDTPPHELLKSKLFSYGIGGKTLKWIDSFLCFRQQRVVVNGVKSDWAPVLSGIPQGTVLGTLLFSLYINDISSDIESEIRLFADDCVCYREIKDEKDTMKLQRDIRHRHRRFIFCRIWYNNIT